MFEWLTTTLKSGLAEFVFLCICLGGAVLTASSMFLGHDSDSDGHGDLGGGHDGGHGQDDTHGGGPSVLSLRGISLMATGFGATAYLVQHYTGKVLVASVSGLMSGWVFAFLCLCIVRVFFRQQVSSLITGEQVLGSSGVIITSIPEKGRGEVRLEVTGRQVIRTAVTEDGAPLDSGTPVTVVRLAADMVIVKKA